MNTPYQKIVKNGEVINGENRRSRRTEAEELKSGKSYLIGKFSFFHCVSQNVEGKEILHLAPKVKRPKKAKKKKSLIFRDKEVLPNGHRKFTIEGKEITALNRKNAIKKFNKMK
jgi:hypothetical protein